MRTFTPEDYVPIFKQFGVTMVIRLNKKTYEANRFTKNGIKHEDIYFLDGSTPTNDKVLKFLELCEKEKGALAVHCKVWGGWKIIKILRQVLEEPGHSLLAM